MQMSGMDKKVESASGLLQDAASWCIVVTHTSLEKLASLPSPVGDIIEFVEELAVLVLSPVQGITLHLLASIDDQIYAAGITIEKSAAWTLHEVTLLLGNLHDRGFVGTFANLWVEHEASIKMKFQSLLDVVNNIPLVGIATSIACKILAPLVNSISEWLLQHSEAKEKTIPIYLKEGQEDYKWDKLYRKFELPLDANDDKPNFPVYSFEVKDLERANNTGTESESLSNEHVKAVDVKEVDYLGNGHADAKDEADENNQRKSDDGQLSDSVRKNVQNGKGTERDEEEKDTEAQQEVSKGGSTVEEEEVHDKRADLLKKKVELSEEPLGGKPIEDKEYPTSFSMKNQIEKERVAEGEENIYHAENDKHEKTGGEKEGIAKEEAGKISKEEQTDHEKEEVPNEDHLKKKVTVLEESGEINKKGTDFERHGQEERQNDAKGERIGRRANGAAGKADAVKSSDMGERANSEANSAVGKGDLVHSSDMGRVLDMIDSGWLLGSGLALSPRKDVSATNSPLPSPQTPGKPKSKRGFLKR
ncbi:hypothetical protein KP509_35G026100 [Ceratopteris richardii]|uniref:Uncharacterized protein n=1 Tax=Ceratopteris richardii TaxID=49495 RepID=A0A8T2QFZ0_CERRI|nr:hypothetical protein KP509_35G026100 [Ceratopteris richardii]